MLNFSPKSTRFYSHSELPSSQLASDTQIRETVHDAEKSWPIWLRRMILRETRAYSRTVWQWIKQLQTSAPHAQKVCGCVGMREKRWGPFLGEKMKKVQARTAGNYPFWNLFIPGPRPKCGARVLSWAPSRCPALPCCTWAERDRRQVLTPT